MNKIKRRRKASWPVRVWLTFVLGACLCAPAHALPQIDGLDVDQISVRELMQLDTEHALKLARGRSSGPERTVSRPERTARSMLGEPSLTAIYGVGNQLMAEVVVDHVIYLYRHGQALPVGVAPGDDILLLQRISASCVDLKNADRTHLMCLSPTQWGGK